MQCGNNSLSLSLRWLDTNKRPDLSPLVSYASSHWNNRKRETGLQTGPYERRRRRCHNSDISNDDSDGEERERGGHVEEWYGKEGSPLLPLFYLTTSFVASGQKLWEDGEKSEQGLKCRVKRKIEKDWQKGRRNR